jgi:hypothetical protein
MKNYLLNKIAKFLAKDFVCNFLIRLAEKNPYSNIGEYMSRYWLVPYSWRLPFAIRIQHIKKPDSEKALHDHPWNFRTFVLKGYYIEENTFGGTRVITEGSTYKRYAHEFHRIARVDKTGVWTLFITGKKYNSWGLWLKSKLLF